MQLNHDVVALYKHWIKAWNDQKAPDMAALVEADGTIIGFDGSLMQGPMEVQETLAQIFQHHPTGRYAIDVRDVRELGSDAALVRAATGMVPREGDDINPAVNAFQTLIGVRKNGQWKIAHFQNTPAAFHGRPEESQKFSAAVRAALGKDGLL